MTNTSNTPKNTTTTQEAIPIITHTTNHIAKSQLPKNPISANADTKNIVVECGSADILHNSFRGNEGPDGLKAGGDPKRRWYMKRRFLVNDRKYRFFLHMFDLICWTLGICCNFFCFLDLEAKN